MRGRDSGELAAGLRDLGVRPGQHLLVHCSLGSVGPVADGPRTVFEALRQVVGQATIVVPAFTPGNSLSSAEFRLATSGLTRALRDRYEDSMLGFDPASTPAEGMGKLAEYMRTLPGAVRSDHPQTSFAACGADAAECGRVHALNGRFGESSPLGWLYRNDAAVLLLGVGYDKFSAFHLAEYLVPGSPARRAYYCFVMAAGERRARELWDVDFDDSDFAALGQRMDSQPFVAKGRVGDADCRLVPIRSAVEFALGDRAFHNRRTTASAGLAAPAERPDTGALPSAPGGGPRLPERYFFLSYARLPPVPPVRGADLADPPDEWVREFFTDLSAAVGRQAAAGSVPGLGFLGTADSTSRHWRSGIAEAIGSVEVFVPLLSPDYYRRSWPRKEWASFLQRLRDARVPDPMRRFTPVLWVPLPTGAQAPELDAALSLADDASLEPYARYGLAALLRQPAYRSCYEQVVGELATRVVAIAEKAPLWPSAVRIHEAAALLSAGIGGKVFTIFISGGNGNQGMAASLADYACLMAERLSYAVQVTDLGHDAGPVGPHPGVLLVDRGTVGGDTAVAALDTKIAGLPPWVLPVVVSDWAAPPASVSTISLEKSHNAYNTRPEIVRRGLDGVGSLQEFVALMPFLVAHAEREYLRHGPIQRAAPRPSSRPGLGGSS